MNYKKRLTFLFVGLFFLVLTTILSYIYVSYADFRRDEFFERLRQKSMTTVTLLVEVAEIDREILKIIDRNTINEMWDEKVLVFDEDDRLIYSSLDDETIPYSARLLELIRTTEDKFYVDEDGDEVVGIHYNENGHDYVVLASAYDQYGLKKLENLRNLIIVSLLAGCILIALATYVYIGQVFKPIDRLNRSIQAINVNNLREFVTVSQNRDELDTLANNYNQMLARLYRAFEMQRAFVRNASHELKTPLAVLQGKLEELSRAVGKDDRKAKEIVTTLIDDVYRQARLIESLLLLERLQSEVPIHTSPVRVDAVLDATIEELSVKYPALRVEMGIDESVTSDHELTVDANPILMRTCIRNLVDNAGLYSSDGKLSVRISHRSNTIFLEFANAGGPELPDEIFVPFFRHPDEQHKQGSGLGLSIVAQIMEKIGGRITYAFADGVHVFRLSIPSKEF